ncbi:Flp family type IVb pilin [Sphingomonas sp. IC-56]|uniref:Flp family type IVb pilin n=1 Tax=Sphingomonas sp. IC-56 TaxID=2898529 RepID=UPI001E3AABA0|nr:Flp family type IVb pilin [Sphingomonas sp. IC-56]MCD2325028.1 Flp family type IVb pilin [Sphingomonas sp. IC-56]
MRALLHRLSLLSRDTKAATAIEYGLIAALIVIAMMTAMMGVATITTDMWNNVSTKVEDASASRDR